MPTTKYTNTLIQVLIGAIQEAPDVLEFVERIQMMEQTLHKLEDNRTSVSSRISAWDRLKFLSTTEDEQEEKDLKQRIKLLKKELERYHEALDERLIEQFRQLCQTREDFRLLQLWDFAQELEQNIRDISCSCDEGFGTVMWDEKARRTVAQLQEFLQFPADPVVTVGYVIAQAKRGLLAASS